MPNILYEYRINISDCIDQDIKMTEISVEKDEDGYKTSDTKYDRIPNNMLNKAYHETDCSDIVYLTDEKDDRKAAKAILEYVEQITNQCKTKYLSAQRKYYNEINIYDKLKNNLTHKIRQLHSVYMFVYYNATKKFEMHEWVCEERDELDQTPFDNKKTKFLKIIGKIENGKLDQDKRYLPGAFDHHTQITTTMLRRVKIIQLIDTDPEKKPHKGIYVLLTTNEPELAKKLMCDAIQKEIKEFQMDINRIKGYIKTCIDIANRLKPKKTTAKTK